MTSRMPAGSGSPADESRANSRTNKGLPPERSVSSRASPSGTGWPMVSAAKAATAAASRPRSAISDETPAAPDRAQQRRLLLRRVRPVQADDDYRGVGDSGRERLQEQQRRYVRPMQIVEYHEHRTGRDHHVHDVVEEPERLSA